NGATTLWELWQNKTGPSMNSHNHPMFGSVGAWMYTALAGINTDSGYRKIRFEPQMVRDLNWASGSIETQRGMVISSWSRTADAVHMEVTIPVGSQAEIVIPKLNFANVEVLESGKTVWKAGAYHPGAPGLTGGKETDRSVTLQAGSGHYTLT